MRHPKLDHDALADLVADLEGWQLAADGGAIEKTYRFADFSEAFGFMARAALAAEKLDHHPDWSNVYRTVRVLLSTHDAGGVTALDGMLARAMDAIAGGHGA